MKFYAFALLMAFLVIYEVSAQDADSQGDSGDDSSGGRGKSAGKGNGRGKSEGKGNGRGKSEGKGQGSGGSGDEQ
ncbi:aspartate and glycine-rich protein-like [Photinus pyralis]|uniref:aspartate and glycine-rich protein-like n=1 Tax=Photinus pyralis TaxID=7054 RepID=UPI001266ED9F|nr:aspartate and glycine-rich protein-like [Photinus pyralis]